MSKLIATIRYLKETPGALLLLKTDREVACLLKRHPLAKGKVISRESFMDQTPPKHSGMATPTEKSCDLNHTHGGNDCE